MTPALNSDVLSPVRVPVAVALMCLPMRLLPEELGNTVHIDWTLREAKDPTKILASGKSSGKSQLFVSSNLQTARNNALPEALERAGENLVSRLANGY